jgi:glycogen phosphorylase
MPVRNQAMSVPAANVDPAFVDTLRAKTQSYLCFTLGKSKGDVSAEDLFHAMSLAIREDVIDAMAATEERYQEAGAKRLYYLSMEFLTGRLLENNVYNLGMADACRQVATRFGVDISNVFDAEYDPALGNGGRGRLAACFLDSLATLGMPGYGYGINYEYGLFRQHFENGFQHERPDHWNASTSPWQVERLGEACVVPLYGRVEHSLDKAG